MNGRTNLQETTARSLTKLEVKEEQMNMMKGSCRRSGYTGLVACMQYHILLPFFIGNCMVSAIFQYGCHNKQMPCESVFSFFSMDV